MQQDTISYVIMPYIRQRQLLKLLPFSHATLWRKVKAQTFPQPVKLSDNITAWKTIEIQQWLEQRSSKL